MITLEDLQKKIKELEERIAFLERKNPNKKIITDYSSTMVKDYITADNLNKKKGGEF